MITIIGAGILGASAAFHLAQQGEKVTLIDREEPGRATHAAAGIVSPWLTQRRNKDWYQLVRNGAKHYPALIDALCDLGEQETGYQKVGSLHLHQDPAIIEKMYQRGIDKKVEAPEIGSLTILNEEETQKAFPVLGQSYQAVHVSGGARVNGRALKDALIRAAKKLGAQYIQGTAQLQQENGHATVWHGRVRLPSERIIDTTGAWSNELLKTIGLTFQVVPQRAQIAHLRLVDQDPSDWPVVIGLNKLYLLTYPDGRIVIGATHDDNVGFDHRPTARGVHEILDRALSAAPGLENATFKEMRVGFRPFTPNSLPLIGKVPAFENLYLANGLGSSGLTSGPYLGYLLSQLVTDQAPHIDLTSYRVEQALK